MKGAIKGN